jgi:small subunit ribosomal protein S16
MSVRIRLKKFGPKNKPTFRIVVTDKRNPRDGRFIEEIGLYNPKLKGENFKIKLDRADHWLKAGAQASDTVRSILKKARKK